MINIIPPEQFKTIPWKNGKGLTTELAINDGASLDNFDWRLSMASVVENGVFSDFTGYCRNLVLIEGHGINLIHNGEKVDRLLSLLDVATFDGSCTTKGELTSGSITDFNIITKINKYKAVVTTHLERQVARIHACDLCFVYCLTSKAQLTSHQDEMKTVSIPPKHLLQLTACINEEYVISGEQMIIIMLSER